MAAAIAHASIRNRVLPAALRRRGLDLHQVCDLHLCARPPPALRNLLRVNTLILLGGLQLRK